MRILQTISALIRGGAERMCIDLSHGLQAKGHEVMILTLVDVNQWRDVLADGSVAIESLSQRHDLVWRRDFLSLVRTFRSAARKFEPHIVHSHSVSSTIVAGLSTHCPHVVTIHNTRHPLTVKGGGLSRELDRILCRFALQRVPGRVVAVTAEAVPGIQNVFRVPTDRITTVWNGIDADPFWGTPRVPSSHTAFRIGMIGSLREKKNHRLAIRALEFMRRMGVKSSLHISGEGVLRPTLEKLVSELGLSDSVVLEGMLSDIPEFLHNIDVFWMTSHHEGHSIALLEAMAAGVPCIVTDVPGLGSFARSWDCALVVPPEDAEALARTTMQLMNDPHQALQLASRAQSVVRDHFTVRPMADEYELIYESTLRSKSGI